MIKYTEYKYHLAALFSVAVWGATFVSTKVLIANSLTPAEIFLLRFAMAYLCILPLSGRRLWASGWRDELTLSVAGITGGSLYFLTENMALEYAPASNVSLIVCTAPVCTAPKKPRLRRCRSRPRKYSRYHEVSLRFSPCSHNFSNTIALAQRL